MNENAQTPRQEALRTETGPKVVWIGSMNEAERNQWDAMARAQPTPFLEWDWLRLMEISGSAAPEAGWLPRHLLMLDEHGIMAAAPLYIKGHSEGEFVFDQVWADVARKLGIEYYPKMLGMSPFTPATAYRFLIRPGVDEAVATRLMMDEIETALERWGLSGLSFNFADPDWAESIRDRGYLAWSHQSYLWENRDYRDFDAFLSAFRANQRKNIRKERRALRESGIEIQVHVGEEIPPEYFDLIWDFYESTNDKFGVWSCKYLSPEFFRGLEGVFRHRMVFFAAYAPGEAAPLAMSMCMRKGPRMWGRYWGTRREIPNLHFEVCYYAPVKWAIEQGIRSFDPGMGGMHKVRRGFTAVASTSLHRLTHPVLGRIMEAHMGEINSLEARHILEINELSPLK